MMKSILDLPDVRIKDKKILVRVDFNVPWQNGKIADDLRIRKTLPLIRHLIKKDAKIILISHLENGEGISSFAGVAKYLKTKYIPRLRFIADVAGKDTLRHIDRMRGGDVLLLDNLRKDRREKNNDRKFSKKLAELADIYVNEAFSVSHREHASVVGVPQFLPSYAGPLFLEEVRRLRQALAAPRPFVLVLGGKKLSTKMGLLSKLFSRADKVLIGGAMANVFLKARGFEVGRSYVEAGVSPDKKILGSVKLFLPVDAVVLRGNKKCTVTIENLSFTDAMYDIGPKTIGLFKREMRDSRFILWNGPFGVTEKGFVDGSREMARALARASAETIVGGGDTISVLRRYKLLNKYSFVSTGGGAMLDFLAQGTLPGIEALRSKDRK
ncbi:MAG: phosphoglycerate kinase [Candidatus Niyogibacteria bacterium]|nr:phosphoglycerate kinase [Candidatus Niyogibacteria bacterium]